MKIFVTGHKGYIGVHLVRLLKERGHWVTGCDLNLFDGCEWESSCAADKELYLDIRNLTPFHLEGHDCIIHLAAISNDPMGELNADLTYGINQKASIELAKNTKRAGVPRFLFASSCSIYGQGKTLDLDETAAVNPLSVYARSKIEAEKEILELADSQFSACCLRNGTAYGYSPMLRLDLVVNNLLACGFTRGDIRITSDGSPWRPLIHAQDIASAFIAFMLAPSHVINKQAVNIGANEENYQVREIGNRIQSLLPSTKIVYTGETGADPRNYRVNFDLLYRLLPTFKLEYTLGRGMKELLESFKKNRLKLSDFEGGKFVRLLALKNRLPLLY